MRSCLTERDTDENNTPAASVHFGKQCMKTTNQAWEPNL